MSYVLCVDAVVFGDGRVSCGAVGRYVSVDDVSGGGDMELCGVDTLFSVAVSGGQCDLDRLSGGGDTAVSGVDTVVVSGVDTVVAGAVSVCLCNLDSVSPGAIVVRVGETSLSGGGDAIVSGVDEPVCSVSSVMTAGELVVCGCGSLKGTVYNVVWCE